MPTLISITKNPRILGAYIWSVKTAKKELSGDVHGGGPSGAAAVAVDKAITFGESDGYSIFAPEEVIELIPHDLRSKRVVGRPPEMSGGKKVNTYLDAESIETAKRLGNGNVSEGIRIALAARRDSK